MKIESGDAFKVASGKTVRVSCVYDVYEGYDTEEQVGDNPTTYVRYSRFWRNGELINSLDIELDEFLELVVHEFPEDEVPESNVPDVGRS